MTFNFADFARSVRQNADQNIGKGATGARDTLAQRQWSWQDGQIGRDGANALFVLDRLGRSPAPDWVACFVSAIGAHMLCDGRSISDPDADWLMDRIGRECDILPTPAARALLRHLSDCAGTMTPALRDFAQAKLALRQDEPER